MHFYLFFFKVFKSSVDSVEYLHVVIFFLLIKHCSNVYNFFKIKNNKIFHGLTFPSRDYLKWKILVFRE